MFSVKDLMESKQANLVILTAFNYVILTGDNVTEMIEVLSDHWSMLDYQTRQQVLTVVSEKINHWESTGLDKKLQLKWMQFYNKMSAKMPDFAEYLVRTQNVSTYC